MKNSHVGHSGRAISGEGKRKCQRKNGTGGRAIEDGGWSNEDGDATTVIDAS